MEVTCQDARTDVGQRGYNRYRWANIRKLKKCHEKILPDSYFEE